MPQNTPTRLKKELKGREALAEIHEGIGQMLSGVEIPTRVVDVSPAIHLRRKCGLRRDELAAKLGVSARTYRGWELGHRTPNGAAQVLLNLVSTRPDLLWELD